MAEEGSVMASGVRRLRFSRKKPNRRPLYVLIVLVLLVAGGWWGFGKLREKGLEIPDPLSVFSSETQPEPAAPSPAARTTADRQASGAVSAAPSAMVDGETSVRRILDVVMTSWVSALVVGNFTDFHALLAGSWQQKDSPAQLKSAYGVLSPYKDNLELFPSRGKLVLLESRPYAQAGQDAAEGYPNIRDTIGPESPWLVRGEWRVNKTALGFTLVLDLEDARWRPSHLRVEIFN
jgi:hypothetical protein